MEFKMKISMEKLNALTEKIKELHNMCMEMDMNVNNVGDEKHVNVLVFENDVIDFDCSRSVATTFHTVELSTVINGIKFVTYRKE
jgi:hypothetical protein